MTSPAQPYGEANVFPALSPVVILFLSYIAEALFGPQLPEGIHKAIVAVATIFTYGVIFLSPLSYAIFKYLVLPTLNWLPRQFKIQSYFLNSIIVLLMTEAILVATFVAVLISHGEVIRWLPLVVAAAVPTAVVALSCIGHICIFKLREHRGADA